jgi:hypothetical protein
MDHYIYDSPQTKKYRYIDTLTNQRFVSLYCHSLSLTLLSYFYQLAPVNAGVAVIQFYSDASFTQLINVPSGFALYDISNVISPMLPYFGFYFVMSSGDYELVYYGTPIWQLKCIRIHAIRALNDAAIGVLNERT